MVPYARFQHENAQGLRSSLTKADEKPHCPSITIVAFRLLEFLSTVPK
jgi:hypothetical protein